MNINTLARSHNVPSETSPTRNSAAKAILLFAPVLFLTGIYFPTSFSGEISKYAILIPFSMISLMCILSFVKSGRDSTFRTINSLSIVCLLLVFTIFSPASEYSLGAIGGYIALALLLASDFKVSGSSTSALSNVFIFSSAINVLASILIISGDSIVQDFFISNYSCFYPELLPNMVQLLRKPVLTFGTHSLAGFFFYLFFYMNLKSFNITGKPLNIVFSILNLAGLIFLASVTSIMFFLVGVVQLTATLTKNRIQSVIAITATVSLILLAAIYFSPENVFGLWNQVTDLTNVIFGSNTNGILGRYSETGNLNFDINYISMHPLSPLGLGYSDDFWYVDSGPIEYILRGSYILPVCIYGGLFIFLRANLLDKRDSALLFIVTLAFEIGFSVLTYVRFIAVLPFIILYLNSLAENKKA